MFTIDSDCAFIAHQLLPRKAHYLLLDAIHVYHLCVVAAAYSCVENCFPIGMCAKLISTPAPFYVEKKPIDRHVCVESPSYSITICLFLDVSRPTWTIIFFLVSLGCMIAGNLENTWKIFLVCQKISAEPSLLTTIHSVSFFSLWMEYRVFHFQLDNILMIR